MHCWVFLLLFNPAGSPLSAPAFVCKLCASIRFLLTGCSERGEGGWFRGCAAHLRGPSYLDRGGSVWGDCSPKPESKPGSGSVCLTSPRMTSSVTLLVSPHDPEMLAELAENSLSMCLPPSIVASITFAICSALVG